MSKKQTEKPILADEMLGKSEEFVIKYKKAIIGGIVAIIACVLGFILYSMYVTEPKEAAANNAIFKGRRKNRTTQSRNRFGIQSKICRLRRDRKSVV